MSRPTFLLLFLLALCGAAGYLLYAQHREQDRLNAELYRLVLALAADNQQAGQQNAWLVWRIESAAYENSQLPVDMPLPGADALHRARLLHARTDLLARVLRGQAAQLRAATGNTDAGDALPYPDQAEEVARRLGPGTPARHLLQTQLDSYAAAVHRLNPKAGFRLAEPNFAGLPTLAALASLAHLEQELRLVEKSTLDHLAQSVVVLKPLWRQRAFASAEAATVAPGDTYRAELMLAIIMCNPYFHPQMSCNGRPVPVDRDAIGHVRFRAPRRPGRVIWEGALRCRQNGRDTTYRVHIPYWVARH